MAAEVVRVTAMLIDVCLLVVSFVIVVIVDGRLSESNKQDIRIIGRVLRPIVFKSTK